MKLIERTPILLLAFSLGLAVSLATRVQRVVINHDTAEHCTDLREAGNSRQQYGNKLAIQIGNQWYMWISCKNQP